MNKMLKRQRHAILLLFVVVIISNIYCYAAVKEKNNQLADLEKINFELQVNSDKLQEVNDTYYNRILIQQSEINDLDEALDRVLTINKKDVEKIQDVVMTETRGASLADAMAVTQTVLDRSTLWDKSGVEIINAPGQYAASYNGAANETVKLAFELVYLDGKKVFKNPVTHFYNKTLCNPLWATNKQVIGNIGNHVYMY